MSATNASTRPPLWLFISDLGRDDLHLVIPSLAWMAEDAGALFECYLESPRDGRLFAQTGSTVLGGLHHHQFNYLHAAFDVRHVLLGESSVFASSVQPFAASVLAQAGSAADLYEKLLALEQVGQPGAVIVGPAETALAAGADRGGDACALRVGSYLFPEIVHRRGLAFTPSQAQRAAEMAQLHSISKCGSLFLSDAELAEARRRLPAVRTIDGTRHGDDIGGITLRIAERWKQQARGVVFGDPPAVLSQLASHCRHRRVALYAPKELLPPQQVRCSAYTEAWGAGPPPPPPRAPR